jgi:hypothetical protein
MPIPRVTIQRTGVRHPLTLWTQRQPDRRAFDRPNSGVFAKTLQQVHQPFLWERSLLPLFVYEWPVFHRTPFRSGHAVGADPAALGSGQGGHVASSRWSGRAMKMAKVGDLLVL